MVTPSGLLRLLHAMAMIPYLTDAPYPRFGDPREADSGLWLIPDSAYRSSRLGILCSSPSASMPLSFNAVATNSLAASRTVPDAFLSSLTSTPVNTPSRLYIRLGFLSVQATRPSAVGYLGPRVPFDSLFFQYGMIWKVWGANFASRLPITAICSPSDRAASRFSSIIISGNFGHGLWIAELLYRFFACRLCPHRIQTAAKVQAASITTPRKTAATGPDKIFGASSMTPSPTSAPPMMVPAIRIAWGQVGSSAPRRITTHVRIHHGSTRLAICWRRRNR